MANIDLSNLTRYDGKIKQYVEDKYLSKNTANWQMTEKAGAVTCYPVPDTELEPIVEFSFKEIPPAEGDKSPSNPSTIEGVSSIKYSKCSKNLIPSTLNGTFTKNGVDFTVLNGIITTTGTSNSNNNSVLYVSSAGGKDLRVLQGHTYSLSGCPIGGSLSTYRISAGYYDNNGNVISYSVLTDYGEGSSFTASQDGWLTTSITIFNGVNASGLIFKPQIEDSLYITSFEPFSQTIYTYQLGNTYYGGSVNLATGEMTVTWGGEYINSFIAIDSNFIQENTVCLAASASFRHLGNVVPHGEFTTNRFISQAYNNDVEHMRQTGGVLLGASGLNFYINKTRLDLSNAVDPSNPTSEEWLIAGNAWLANNPIFYVGKLFNPYVIQLDPVQIKSLTALDKNTPRLNTLYTDADSIQVGYQKHPARTAYELENAILALGGGE